MIPAKNLFTGSLGKLQNVGGSKFFTTPHTVQVPHDYQIDTAAQENFVTCSLDGRLWLFSDYCVALKWNENTLQMQTATSIQVSNNGFIARGIDWILTADLFLQVLDDTPYIFSENISFDSNLNIDSFYSFLPPLDGWQIIGNFLVRRSGNNADNPVYSLNAPAGLFLTHKDNAVWGKNGSFVGVASITGDSDYSLEISQDHSLSDNFSGLAFIADDLFGFNRKQDNSLCLVSQDCRLFSVSSGTWLNVFNDEDISGNIFFDPFNYSAVAVRDNQVNLLPEKKLFQAKGIAQWIAPTRNIAGVTDDFVIAQIDRDILATHVNSGLYREFLQRKNLALSSNSYSGLKLAVGVAENSLRFNSIQVEQFEKAFNIWLVNTFVMDISNVNYPRL